MKNTFLLIVLALSMWSCGENVQKKEETPTPPPPTVVQKKVSTKPSKTAPVKVDQDKTVSVVTEAKKDKNTVTGIFKYMADAAIFKDCNSGKKMGVAMDKAYLQLEKLYLATVEGGTPVFITLKGKIETRKAMEGKKTEQVLVIEKLLSLEKDKRCGE